MLVVYEYSEICALYCFVVSLLRFLFCCLSCMSGVQG